MHWKQRRVVGAVKWKDERTALFSSVIAADVTQKLMPDATSSGNPSTLRRAIWQLFLLLTDGAVNGTAAAVAAAN